MNPTPNSVATLTAITERLERCSAKSPLTSPSDKNPSRPQSLSDISQGKSHQAVACTFIAYFWSPLMPLSSLGIVEAMRAGSRLSVPVLVVNADEVAKLFADSIGDSRSVGMRDRNEIVRDLVIAGATTHYPAVVTYIDGTREGNALLGFKTAESLASVLGQRLEDRRQSGSSGVAETSRATSSSSMRVDYPTKAAIADVILQGSPGAYFRAIPGSQTVAFADGDRVQVVNLRTRLQNRGPGYVDLVPSPDGRFLVSPMRNRGGLRFYSTPDVLNHAAQGRGHLVSPVFVDSAMVDHYPSIARFDSNTKRTATYRVLTSWSDRVRFRDYRVTASEDGSLLRVKPRGKAMPACRGPISIAIIGPGGRELAARDETSGRTKILHMADDGECDELLDLGVAAGKVAWSRDGNRIAFTVPRGTVRDGRGVLWRSENAMAGIFVLDRQAMVITKVPGSEMLNGLTFPDLVGDSVLFLLPPDDSSPSSRMRVVCCMGAH